MKQLNQKRFANNHNIFSKIEGAEKLLALPIIKNSICAIVFCATPLSSYAAFLGDLGSVPPPVSDTRNNLAMGAYDDYYTFSSGADISDVAIAFTLQQSGGSYFQAGSFDIQLFEGVTSPVGTTIAGALSGGGQSSVFFFADLASDTDYTLRTNFNFISVGGTANAIINVEAYGFNEGEGGDDGDNVSAVPIPAAAWLFGSALIGLAGLSRKK
jgi:hypothetical protein